MAFVERKLELVKFDKPGVVVQGRLKKVTRQKFDDGAGLRYNVRRTDGTVLEFTGSTVINSKLSPSDIGCNVHVEYLGEDETGPATQGRSRMKLFKVMVDESDREVQGGPGITDEDIPF